MIMMIYLTGLVGFLLVLTAEAGVGSSKESSYCTETDECLLFEFVCQNKDYEIRRYDSVHWVSISFRAPPALCLTGAIFEFRHLKRYLDDNKIPMETAPVTVKIQKASFWPISYCTMNILLPSEHQSNPPKPTNSKVKIVKSGEMFVYVRSYSGCVFKDVVESKRLFRSINMSSNKKPHYAVGYNSLTYKKPYSEVWVEVEGARQC